MAESVPNNDLTRLTETLAVQLEASRRRFLRGNAMYVSANLVLAGLAWRLPGGGVTGWLPAAIGVLGNVFYALTTEWELRWHALWRREIPRIETQTGLELLSKLRPETRRLSSFMRILSWLLALLWMAILVLQMQASGLDIRIVR